MAWKGRDGVERDLCGRCRRVAEEPSPGEGLRRATLEVTLPGEDALPGVPVVLCERCHGELLRAERGRLGADPGDDGGGDPSAERLAELLRLPPLSTLLPVVGTGGRTWSSFRFACGHCPRTVREEEARGRVLDGGEGAVALEVAAACAACGHVTPYQVVFHDDGIPRFHRDRAVPIPPPEPSRHH